MLMIFSLKIKKESKVELLTLVLAVKLLLTQMLMVSSNERLVNKDSMLQLVRYCAESKGCTSSANKNHLGLEVLLLG